MAAFEIRSDDAVCGSGPAQPQIDGVEPDAAAGLFLFEAVMIIARSAVIGYRKTSSQSTGYVPDSYGLCIPDDAEVLVPNGRTA